MKNFNSFDNVPNNTTKIKSFYSDLCPP